VRQVPPTTLQVEPHNRPQLCVAVLLLLSAGAALIGGLMMDRPESATEGRMLVVFFLSSALIMVTTLLCPQRWARMCAGEHQLELPPPPAPHRYPRPQRAVVDNAGEGGDGQSRVGLDSGVARVAPTVLSRDAVELAVVDSDGESDEAPLLAAVPSAPAGPDAS
jgi:hypothetical protein